jgi:hypothetical protein
MDDGSDASKAMDQWARKGAMDEWMNEWMNDEWMNV